MAEMPASETVDRAVECAVQDFDNSGCAKNLPIENCRRDVRVNRTSNGTSEIHRSTIAPAPLKGTLQPYDPATQ